MLEHALLFYSIDATQEPVSGPRLARLANHADAKKQENSRMRVQLYGGQPALCLFALRDINKNEEIRYNYGVSVPWKVHIIFYCQQMVKFVLLILILIFDRICQ